ncbi:MAG TPA: heat-inducible transcriptional repressor HrcA [Thermoanaerobaculia bacterium]|nr:heat-inducible transcriptional repressor HrcA [Thermoanaerobaculia bacterium]
MARDLMNFDELETRSRDVLREIVMQYVATGEPISSRSLARRGGFELSPASLRNVMADLEDLGYLSQPHTSAGRVPTDRGYRFFIDHLMKSRRLSQHEKDVIDERVSRADELDEVMHHASSLLSQLSNQVGLAFIPTLHHLVMRSMDFVQVGERKILCVIVGTNGVIVNQIIEIQDPPGREELLRISSFISGEFHGLALEIVRERMLNILEDERARHDTMLARTMRLGSEAVSEVLPHERELHLEGATSILDKPEFADAESMRKTFLAFEEKEKLVDILNRCLNEDGLQILVGAESQFTRNYNFSLIATRCGSASSPLGMVGVIGPTRMEYGRLAPLVDYIGKALSRKIEESGADNRD